MMSVSDIASPPQLSSMNLGDGTPRRAFLTAPGREVPPSGEPRDRPGRLP